MVAISKMGKRKIKNENLHNIITGSLERNEDGESKALRVLEIAKIPDQRKDNISVI